MFGQGMTWAPYSPDLSPCIKRRQKQSKSSCQRSPTWSRLFLWISYRTISNFEARLRMLVVTHPKHHKLIPRGPSTYTVGPTVQISPIFLFPVRKYPQNKISVEKRNLYLLFPVSRINCADHLLNRFCSPGHLAQVTFGKSLSYWTCRLSPVGK